MFHGVTMDDRHAGVPSARKFQTVEVHAAKDDSTNLNTELSKDDPTNPTKHNALIDLTLEFLATSSNEALLSVSALLIIATYVIFGRLGLVLIGVVIGIAWHASWEGTKHDYSDHGARTRCFTRRRELALEVTTRLLERPKRKSTAADTRDGDTPPKASEEMIQVDLEYSTFRPLTAAALRSLTDAVINDYVKFWYEPILPSEPTFPLSCQRILTGFVTSVSLHLSRKRTADTFLQFLTNSSSIIIVFLNELSAAFGATDARLKTSEQTVRQYLELFQESSLANVLANQQQRKKLNMVADDILSTFLDPKVYGCSALRDFLREILAGVILESTISSLSRPEFINSWIIYLLRDGESEIMSAIDAGVEGAQKQTVAVSKAAADMGDLALTSDDNCDGGKSNSSDVSSEHYNHADKATEEALLETKRLSALIAAQDTLKQNQEQVLPADASNMIPSSTGEDNATQLDLESSKNAGDAAAKPNELIKGEAETSTAPLETPQSPSFTLHGAWVSVDDDSDAGEKGTIRSKPTSDYFLQIEPASSRFPGWMISRRYADFESLHETLETISRLNNLQSFRDKYPTLPTWKGQTRKMLARNLEQYLQDALRHDLLAESSRMRRFLEKDGGLGPAGPSSKIGSPFRSQGALESMSKGVLDVLTNAPKGVAGGGRAVLDGVTGVFGTVAGTGKKSSGAVAWSRGSHLQKSSVSNEDLPRTSEHPREFGGHQASLGLNRDSNNSSLLSMANEMGSPPSVEHESSNRRKPSSPEHSGVSSSNISSTEHPSNKSTSLVVLEGDDCVPIGSESQKDDSMQTAVDKGRNEHPEPARASRKSGKIQSQAEIACSNTAGNQNKPITDEETQIAVELIFAVINELYTLSSAWNIRRTLLNAAKSYILRPGSPNLETIRVLLQDSMIDAHISDEAIAAYITKLRENALPTEAERNSWPRAPDEAEKERLKETARKLFVQRGIPQALMSVMGAAASREALEKIFDCLQVEVVARGFVFSLLLQALKAIIV